MSGGIQRKFDRVFNAIAGNDLGEIIEDSSLLSVVDKKGLPLIAHMVYHLSISDLSSRLNTINELHLEIDLNAEITAGVTSLHLCAKQGWLEKAKLLLAFGADPLRRTTDNQIPLEFAIQADKDELFELLLPYSFSPDDEALRSSLVLHAFKCKDPYYYIALLMIAGVPLRDLRAKSLGILSRTLFELDQKELAITCIMQHAKTVLSKTDPADMTLCMRDIFLLLAQFGGLEATDAVLGQLHTCFPDKVEEIIFKVTGRESAFRSAFLRGRKELLACYAKWAPAKTAKSIVEWTDKVISVSSVILPDVHPSLRYALVECGYELTTPSRDAVIRAHYFDKGEIIPHPEKEGVFVHRDGLIAQSMKRRLDYLDVMHQACLDRRDATARPALTPALGKVSTVLLDKRFCGHKDNELTTNLGTYVGSYL